MPRGKLLARLDDIAWEDLEHALGPADDVPARIRELASAVNDVREKARQRLASTLRRDGSVYSATAAAVPFLVELAVDPATPGDRAWIVRFLADLAVGAPSEWMWAGFDPAAPDAEAYLDADADAADAYEAVESALDALLGLLADPDPVVRASVAMTASFFARKAAKVRTAAWEAIARETDARAIASLLLCAAMQDGYAGDRASQPRMRGVLEDAAKGSRTHSAALALAAASALSFGEAPGVGADPTAIGAFARAIADAPERWEGFPWCDGSVASLAIAQLAKHAAHDTEQMDVYFGLVERAGEDASSHDVALARGALVPLLALVTKEHASAPLRRLAEAVARRPMLANALLFDRFAENGLPDDLAPLRELFGVRSDGPREMPVTIDGVTRPAHEWSRDPRLVDAIAKLPVGEALALAAAFPDEPFAPAIVDAAAARDAAGTHVAALALAARFAEKGPPVVYGRVQVACPRAMTLVARAAARVAEHTGAIPEPIFDVMIEAELGDPRAWGDLERYFRALPQERVESVLLGLATRGFARAYPDVAPIRIDRTVVDRMLVLVEEERRERLVVAIAEHGDFRALLADVGKHATPPVVEALLLRVAEELTAGDGDDDDALERDAGALGAAGLAAFATVRRVAERRGASAELVRLCEATLEAIDGKSFLGSAMRDARIDVRDERGLVPLDDARRVVEATRVYRKGDGEMKDGTFVLDSDRVWAALLSLGTAEELVRHAKRIEWEFHVRGRDNVAPFERWGAAMLPWVESQIDEHGVLANVPWCLVPCLLAMDGKDALRVALAASGVHELLPGQAALGSGPGVFADDDDDEDDDDDADDGDDDDDALEDDDAAPPSPKGFVAPTTGLDLARRWIARHPHGYAMLAELADEGHARAAELLRERAAALGGIVQEAVEASLGRDRTAAIAKKLGLPRSALAPEVEAVLAEAETLDEPRGPLWTIGELDDAAREYDLPLWDNARYTAAAMRITGFASRHGDALVIETLSTNPSAGDRVGWDARAFGPGAREKQYGELVVDEARNELGRIELDGPDYVDGVSKTIHLWGKRNEVGKSVKGSSGAVVVPHPMPPEHVSVEVKRAALGMRGVEQRVGYKLPRSFAALPEVAQKALRHVTPDEGLLVQLCAKHAGAMFALEAGLKDKLGLPADAVPIFSFDDFEWIAAGEPASKSKDLVLVVEALRRRKKIARLVGKANTRAEAWLARHAEERSYAGGDAWPAEDGPIEPAYPDAGAFASPYDAWLVAERGWPHGITLLHAPEHNTAGQAEQTIAHVMGAAERAMHGSWPRRTACLWARVVGSAEAWSPGDKAALKAMRNDAMLYAPEARKLVARFAARASGPPAFVGSELVWIVEALCGPKAALEAFTDALDALSPAAFAKDHPPLAAAVLELGFVLRRAAPKDRDGFAKRLAARFAKATEGRVTGGDVVRALDLVLHGRKGAERSARSEGDYVLVADDPGWARERLLDPATPASRPDLQALLLAGDGMLDKWAARLGAISDPGALGLLLARAGGPKAFALLLRTCAGRPEAQEVVATALVARADAEQALGAALRGPEGETARGLLETMRRKTAEEVARRESGAANGDVDDDDDDDAIGGDDDDDFDDDDLD